METELKATAQERQYRIRIGKTGRTFLQRRNKFDGTWKFVARESTARWDVAMDMIRRGWAVLIP